MLAHCVLPGVEQSLVLLLLMVDTLLVLDLRELGCPLLVHFVLQVAAHGPITLANLTEDVSLVALLVHGGRHCLLFVSNGLPHDFGIVLRLFVVLEPRGLLLQLLLEKDVLLAVLVDVLHQVNASLVFAAPLGFLGFPLLDIFVLDELLDHFFIGRLVLSLLAVVLLELDDLISESLLLGSFNVLDISFSLHGSCK